MNETHPPRRLAALLGKAALGTLGFGAIFSVAIVGLANADPTGSATGGAADLAAKVVGSPTVSEIAADLGHLQVGTNLFFILVGFALIFFMQAGFLAVETGFCRAKNAANVAAMNLGIFAVGALAYWLVGFGLQFGGVGVLHTVGGSSALSSSFALFKGWPLFGTTGFALTGKAYDVAVAGMFLFHLGFMDTAATIPTGAMAERWKFSAFAIYGLWMAAIIFPVYGAWVWGGGWLARLGVNVGLGHGAVDFAGSGVVHAVGGLVGLAGAMVLGPRIGKFKKDGMPVAIPGHDIPLAILGTIVLTFGWIGFNGMSTLAATDLRFPVIVTNTILSACAGSLASWMLVWRLWGKPDPSMIANGMLAGLVAVTASCAFVSPLGAVVIGAVAGVLVVAGVVFLERVLKIDDPVGAISVHGLCGLWGLLAVGLFADGTYGQAWNGVAGPVRGLLYGGGVGQLGAQLVSALVVVLWAFGIGYLFFRVQDALTPGGIRSTSASETVGIDASEMGSPAYPDFLGPGRPGTGDVVGIVAAHSHSGSAVPPSKGGTP